MDGRRENSVHANKMRYSGSNSNMCRFAATATRLIATVIHFPFIHLFTFSSPVLIGFMQRAFVMPNTEKKTIAQYISKLFAGVQYIHKCTNLKTEWSLNKNETKQKREREKHSLRDFLHFRFISSNFDSWNFFCTHIFFV